MYYNDNNLFLEILLYIYIQFLIVVYLQRYGKLWDVNLNFFQSYILGIYNRFVVDIN